MFVKANAKINIGLFVTSKREDGYHNLETIYYPISLSDELELESCDAPRGDCLFESNGLPINCNPESNLVVRAFKLLRSVFDLPAVKVTLTKNIPWGAGLGGGSSDATFMLRALNDYFKLDLSEIKLMRYASKLGSDCPFFIKNRPMYATGTGNEMENINLSLDDWKIVLVKPDCEVLTSEAYAGIIPSTPVFNLRDLENLPVEHWQDVVHNDFESTIFTLHPEIAMAKHRLYELGAVYAQMTGSGSAVFGIFPKDATVTEIANCKLLM